jgi:predicted nucleic acid-binding protein
MLPKKISLDPYSLVVLMKKSNKEALEFILAEFEVYISLPSLHAYLLAKTLAKRDPREETAITREIFNIVEPNDELIAEMARVDAALSKQGVFLDYSTLMVAISAIITDSLLVVYDEEDIEKYKVLSKYGLDIMPFDRFMEKLMELVREEARKEKLNGVNGGK